VYNLDPTLALLVRSICRPFRARRSEWRFPGLKPWAESSGPFGAETSRRDFGLTDVQGRAITFNSAELGVLAIPSAFPQRAQPTLAATVEPTRV